jgi:hypothetical protein
LILTVGASCKKQSNANWHLAKNKAMPTVSHAPSNYLMKKILFSIVGIVFIMLLHS